MGLISTILLNVLYMFYFFFWFSVTLLLPSFVLNIYFLVYHFNSLVFFYYTLGSQLSYAYILTYALRDCSSTLRLNFLYGLHREKYRGSGQSSGQEICLRIFFLGNNYIFLHSSNLLLLRFAAGHLFPLILPLWFPPYLCPSF